jgi:hypothetical protein
MSLLSSLAFAAPPQERRAPPQRVQPAHHEPPRPAVAPRPDAGPRNVGVHITPHPEQPVHPVNNPPYRVTVHNQRANRDENHPVIVDRRPIHVIDHDPRLRVVRRGYHPVHNWEHFQVAETGWWRVWGISSWNEVGTVTCEAANEQTGELFPVSEDRDQRAWDDGTVNAILDQALDDCAAEAGESLCVPATPSCSFQRY